MQSLVVGRWLLVAGRWTLVIWDRGSGIWDRERITAEFHRPLSTASYRQLATHCQLPAASYPLPAQNMIIITYTACYSALFGVVARRV
jgi:hypothetical protein